MGENGIHSFQPGRHASEPDDRHLAGRRDVARALDVVEGLPNGGNRDDPTDPDEPELADRAGSQQPFAAADGDAERDEARSDDELDDLPDTEPADLEDM